MTRRHAFILLSAFSFLACRDSAQSGDLDDAVSPGGSSVITALERDEPPANDILVRLDGRFAEMAPFAVAVTRSGEVWNHDAMSWVIDERASTIRWLPAPRRWRVQPYGLTPQELDRLQVALWTSGLMNPGETVPARAGPLVDGILIEWHLLPGEPGHTLKARWISAEPIPAMQVFYHEVRSLLLDAENRWMLEQGF